MRFPPNPPQAPRPPRRGGPNGRTRPPRPEAPSQGSPDGSGPSDAAAIVFDPTRRGNPYVGVKRALVFASGARPEILSQCPTEEATYVGIGGTVFATAILSGIAMAFALSNAVGTGLLVALIGATVWGAIIFNLDRWLIASQRRMPNKRGQIFAALPRIILALLIGFVISEPLLHEVFRSEIEAKKVDINFERRAEQAEKIDNSQYQKRIEAFDAQIAALAQPRDPTTPQEAQLRQEAAGLQKAIDAAQQVLNEKQIALTAEIEGASVTGRAGCGPVCLVKRQERDVAQADLDRVRGENGARISALIQEADAIRARNRAVSDRQDEERRDQIASLEERRAEAAAQLEAERSQNDRTEADGLLADVRALDELMWENTSILVTRLLLLLLLLGIDTVPVVGKLIMLLGPPRPYEQACDAVDALLTGSATRTVDEAELERVMRFETIRREHQIRRDAEESNLEAFVAHAAETQRIVGERILDQWREEQLTQVDRDLRQGPSNGRSD